MTRPGCPTEVSVVNQPPHRQRHHDYRDHCPEPGWCHEDNSNLLRGDSLSEPCDSSRRKTRKAFTSASAESAETSSRRGLSDGPRPRKTRTTRMPGLCEHQRAPRERVETRERGWTTQRFRVSRRSVILTPALPACPLAVAERFEPPRLRFSVVIPLSPSPQVLKTPEPSVSSVFSVVNSQTGPTRASKSSGRYCPAHHTDDAFSRSRSLSLTAAASDAAPAPSAKW